jgi:periplasmic divalent cation tolerance protein
VDASRPAIVFTTFPLEFDSERVIRDLIEQRLTACAHVFAPGKSLYWWKGKIETATEVQVLFKTTESRSRELISAIAGIHPYENPELLAVPVANVSPAYLRWLNEAVSISA